MSHQICFESGERDVEETLMKTCLPLVEARFWLASPVQEEREEREVVEVVVEEGEGEGAVQQLQPGVPRNLRPPLSQFHLVPPRSIRRN